MTSSSSRRSSFLALIALSTSMSVALSGCLTGSLIESGRLHERVSRYERISIDERNLVIDYTVVVSKSATGRNATSGRSQRRTAVLSIEDLDARPPHPTDAFPLRRIRSWPRHSTSPRHSTPLPIRITIVDGEGSEPAPPTLGAASNTSDVSDVSDFSDLPSGPRVEITEHVGRHLDFRVCPGDSDRRMTRVSTADAADLCLGPFHSAALYDDHLAWWIYPLAPITAAIDLALLPIQVVTLPPLLLLGD